MTCMQPTHLGPVHARFDLLARALRAGMLASAHAGLGFERNPFSVALYRGNSTRGQKAVSVKELTSAASARSAIEEDSELDSVSCCSSRFSSRSISCSLSGCKSKRVRGVRGCRRCPAYFRLAARQRACCYLASALSSSWSSALDMFERSRMDGSTHISRGLFRGKHGRHSSPQLLYPNFK